MIILSVGMPRSGSGWYYNLTNDLMLADGAEDARDIRQKFHLESILTEVNCNIGALTPRRLLAVLVPSLLGNTFVIKAHAGPTPLALAFIRRKLLLPTYLYRDPRDALLSVMENGARARQRGQENAFSPYVEFDAAVRFMRGHLHIWKAWLRCESALHVRYEDLLTDYPNETARLIDYLPLRNGTTALAPVIERYQPENTAQPDQKGLHFSHGKIGRFRRKLSADQQATLQDAFGSTLEKMGYPP